MIAETDGEHSGTGQLREGMPGERATQASIDRGHTAMSYKGYVKGNVVILEKGIYLPDGVHATVTVEQEEQPEPREVTDEELVQRRALGERMKAFGQRLAGRYVNLGDRVIEGREELEALA